MELKKKSSGKWLEFYEKSKGSFASDIQKYFLNSFQKVIFNEIRRKARKLMRKKRKVCILSAGSGIDTIAYKLDKLNKRINVTIMDISPLCIKKNKELFGNGFNFIVGDIFKHDLGSNKYDLVYNTGLLEHFTEKEQDEIASRILKSLKKGGYYITLNPYHGGKIYTKCMKNAIKKGKWKYGREVPLKSLKRMSRKDVKMIKEYPCCSLLQLGFYLFTNKAAFLLLLPLIAFGRIFYIKSIDMLFGKLIGYYGLISILQKSRH